MGCNKSKIGIVGPDEVPEQAVEKVDVRILDTVDKRKGPVLVRVPFEPIAVPQMEGGILDGDGDGDVWIIEEESVCTTKLETDMPDMPTTGENEIDNQNCITNVRHSSHASASVSSCTQLSCPTPRSFSRPASNGSMIANNSSFTLKQDNSNGREPGSAAASASGNVIVEFRSRSHYSLNMEGGGDSQAQRNRDRFTHGGPRCPSLAKLVQSNLNVASWLQTIPDPGPGEDGNDKEQEANEIDVSAENSKPDAPLAGSWPNWSNKFFGTPKSESAAVAAGLKLPAQKTQIQNKDGGLCDARTLEDLMRIFSECDGDGGVDKDKPPESEAVTQLRNCSRSRIPVPVATWSSRAKNGNQVSLPLQEPQQQCSAGDCDQAVAMGHDGHDHSHAETGIMEESEDMIALYEAAKLHELDLDTDGDADSSIGTGRTYTLR